MSLNYSELFWIISKTISKKTSRRLSPVLWRSQSVVCWCQICTRDFFQIFWCIFSWWLEVEASRGSCMALAEMVCCKDRKKFVWNQRKNRKQDSSKIRISCLPWSILKAIRCLARPSIPGQGRKNDGSPKGFGMEDSIFAVGGIFFWMLWYFSAVKRMLWNVCICFGMLQHFSDLLMNYPLMSYPNLSNDSTMPKTITPATFFSLPLWMFPQGRGQNTRFGRTYYSIFMHTVIYTANFS